MRHRFVKVTLGLAAFLLLGGTATVAARSHHASAASYNVGIIYSRTGLLSAYGAEYVEGLKFGLQYATNGTGKVNGKAVNFTFQDDKTDPVTAVSEAKDLIGQGYKIIAGTESSGIALQIAPLAAQNQVLYISGPAASDAITAVNKYTFRSGRQTLQDVYDAASFLGKATGKKVVVFDQDSVFGHGNYAAVKAVLGGKGHTVTEISVPLSATDMTPFAQQAKQAGADLLFVAWAGSTAGSMWKALDQQGVFTGTPVVTGLAERATWSALGDQATKIQFLSHYVYTAPKNKVNDWLVQQLRKRGQVPDLFTPDGFVAAQMIVHALQVGDGDVDKMITALEGWKFLAPKGYQAIRPQDHAMLQPMFRVKLVQGTNGKLMAQVLGTASTYDTAPPVVAMKG